MKFWSDCIQKPQTVWLRRALFQVHLWTGIGLGLYILVISVTGSVLVFRVELLNAFTVERPLLAPQGPRLDDDGLRRAAAAAYPDYIVTQVFNGREPEHAVEIWLDRDDDLLQRLFNPFTGEDLGDSVPPGIRLMSWILDLHDNLLFDDSGRAINGWASVFFTLLCLTGMVIWWPGIRSWPRSMYVQLRTNWKRINWSLHSAMGFWLVLLLAIWGVSGVYLVFPTPFSEAADWIQPFNTESFEPRLVDDILVWLTRLHFGRFAGIPVKILWAVLGLAPAVLFVTGAIMWWNRVLRRAA